jgi:hypothetical protein
VSWKRKTLRTTRPFLKKNNFKQRIALRASLGPATRPKRLGLL